jgi:hypothetical protein
VRFCPDLVLQWVFGLVRGRLGVILKSHKAADWEVGSPVSSEPDQDAVFRLLSGFPDESTRTIGWAVSSPCATYSMEWNMRQRCMEALLRIAVQFRRTVVLPNSFLGVLDVNQLSNWFPVYTQSKFDALVSTPVKVASITVDLSSLSPQEASEILSSSDVVSQCRASVTVSFFATDNLVRSQKSVSIFGESQDVILFANNTCKVQEDLMKQMQWTISPNAPSRVKLKCMRVGGPLSPTNANPTCPDKGLHRKYEYVDPLLLGEWNNRK